MKETSAYYFLRTAKPNTVPQAPPPMCIKLAIVLHEQNIIYLLAQVERTDKDQSDRNTAVPAAVALLQRGRDDKEKQHVAYKVVPACMAQHMTKQPNKKQRIGQRRTIDAEKMIGRPPIGQVTPLLT